MKAMNRYRVIFQSTLLAGMVLFAGSVAMAAGVEFNFQPVGAPFTGGINPAGSGAAGNDGTRFYQDTIDIDGVKYFHVVVGDPATGFAIESYVTAATIATGQNADHRASSPDSGGNERALIGSQAELSLDQGAIIQIPGRQFGNAKDPLGVTVNPASGFKHFDLSGNGTANPNRAMLRMVVGDAQMSQEVFKPLLGRKPLISQVTVDSDSQGEMVGQFIADLRGLTYSDMKTAAPLFNRLSILSPDFAVSGIADFDMSHSQRSNVTAGRYTFTPGAGWSAPTDPDGQFNWDVDGSTFDEGSYTYSDGAGFNLEGINWGKFFDYDQNAVACSTGYRQQSVCPQ